ncbi:alpha/beta-hydrolase [Aulographum hederae CBS 113979]|uniref:Dipeptidyl-peptidase V n=1 Tax=Aulographum hederae CBS 113979 TaxID=1176131 RepID=A0A6G1HGZ5_9PEZI|nr:alpha/beta-hydrolase [Aulographum hederae CBS 113979]
MFYFFYLFLSFFPVLTHFLSTFFHINFMSQSSFLERFSSKRPDERTTNWSPTHRAYLAGTINAAISDLQTKILPTGNIALAFTAIADKDGNLASAGSLAAAKPPHTAMEFETTKVRYWNEWWKLERSSLWYTTLCPISSPTSADSTFDSESGESTKYKLSANPPTNALKNTAIEFPWCNSPLGEGGSFSLSTTGLLITAVDPQWNPAKEFRLEVYYLPLTTFSEAPAPPLKQIQTPAWEGRAIGGVFDVKGEYAAFVKNRNRYPLGEIMDIFVAKLKGVEGDIVATRVDAVKIGGWEPLVMAVLWSEDSKTLFLGGEDRGRDKLYALPVDLSDLGGEVQEVREDPVLLTPDDEGSVNAVYRLPDGKLFLNSSSLTDSSTYTILDPSNPSAPSTRLLSSFTENGIRFGLSRTQISEFTFPSKDGTYNIHSFLLTPSFPSPSPSKTSPVALLIHGGPQSAWKDAWSTRWNPLMWAEQGYIVVMPNITGSTGYGDKMREAVAGDWCGRGTEDLEACLEWVERECEGADLGRCVALGGSYGGKRHISVFFFFSPFSLLMIWLDAFPVGMWGLSERRRDREESTVQKRDSDLKKGANHREKTSMTEGKASKPTQPQKNKKLTTPFPAGYMINHLAGVPLSTRFATLVSHNGPFSLTSQNLASDTPWAVAHDTGSHLWDSPAVWTHQDPSTRTSTWTRPMLFIHSPSDFRVPVTEGLAAYMVCQMRGIESRWLGFEGEGHWVLGRENSLVWWGTVLGWVNRYAGNGGVGRVELGPPVTEVGGSQRWF